MKNVYYRFIKVGFARLSICRGHNAEIVPVRRKIKSNQSINQPFVCIVIVYCFISFFISITESPASVF